MYRVLYCVFGVVHLERTAQVRRTTNCFLCRKGKTTTNLLLSHVLTSLFHPSLVILSWLDSNAKNRARTKEMDIEWTLKCWCWQRIQEKEMIVWTRGMKLYLVCARASHMDISKNRAVFFRLLRGAQCDHSTVYAWDAVFYTVRSMNFAFRKMVEISWQICIWIQTLWYSLLRCKSLQVVSTEFFLFPIFESKNHFCVYVSPF